MVEGRIGASGMRAGEQNNGNLRKVCVSGCPRA